MIPTTSRTAALKSAAQEGTGARDALTNALTRPAFLAMLQAFVADAVYPPFAVCLLDVDQLKNVNDRLGFEAGDRVLIDIARRVLTEIGREQWAGMQCALARYDGDALIVLAQPADSQRAAALAEALRHAVAREPFAQATVTVSIGAAEHRAGESADTLLARTERALHVAKQFGRDRVELAESPPRRPRRARVVRLQR